MPLFPLASWVYEAQGNSVQGLKFELGFQMVLHFIGTRFDLGVLDSFPKL